MSDLNNIYDALKAPFPEEAYSSDDSRGFSLTSLKAQYVVERLNDVFGLGNWSLEGSYDNTEEGVLFFGSLVAQVGDRKIETQNVGYAALKKNVGDAYKSARTDCLSKCASWFGLGNEMYKGNIKINKQSVKPNTTNNTQDFKKSSRLTNRRSRA